MRFHHSTRRGRNRLNPRNQYNSLSNRVAGSYSTSRWSQLNYCKDTNIHFNRRLPVEAPSSLASEWGQVAVTLSEIDQPSSELFEPLNSVVQSSAPCSPSHKATEKHSLEARLRQLSFNNQLVLPIDQANGTKSVPRRNDKSKTMEEQPTSSNSSLDIETARERLISQVQKHPFWSNKAAKRMQITSLDERHIYIYELVSFCERRQLEWRYEPYRGGLVSAIGLTRRFDHQSSFARLKTEMGSPMSQYIMNNDIEHSIRQVRSKLEASQPVGGSFDENDSSNNRLTTRKNQPIDQLASQSNQANRLQRLSQLERSCSTASSAGIRAPTSIDSANLIGGSQPLYEPNGSTQRPLPNSDIIWSIEVPLQSMPKVFTGYVHTSELPNSSFIKKCHGCQGKGKLKCKSCHGVGYEVCLSCSGKGTTRNLSSFRSGRESCSYSESHNSRRHDKSTENSDSSPFYSSEYNSRRDNSDYEASSGLKATAWLTESCHFCHGAGQKRCWICAGKSYNHCPGCLGSGQLRCYLNLHVSFINHRDEGFLNNPDSIIPKDRLRLCKGRVLMDEVKDHLNPMDNFNIPEFSGKQSNADETNQLRETSRNMIEKHYQTYRNERLIKQKHRLTLIECHIVGYEWRKRKGNFVIYGDERKVYIAKYPFKSICNIT